MDDRDWMYTGRQSKSSWTKEWLTKTQVFLNQAFINVKGKPPRTFCPCSECANRKRQTKKEMGRHLIKYGFIENYKRWTSHGEAHRVRHKVIRPRIDEAFDEDAGVAVADIHYNPDDPPEAYNNPSAHSRLNSYSEVAKEVYGSDYNRRSHDLDGEVVMRVGGGKTYGRYYLPDSIIDTASTPTLSQIRVRTISGGPSIRQRPMATQSLQAQLEEERRKREELEATMAQRVQEQVQEQLQEHVQVQMLEMYSFFQAQFAAMGHQLPTQMPWAPCPPLSSPPTPGSMGSHVGAGSQPDVDLSAARALSPPPPPSFAD